eukprot:TRINITY_DN3246_c0_g1_i1.p2 TRINITY_DN3246_c0_g1~~TRINITY_DN3246_c0_g1_i1.p2  ORF type:complete len:150 (+),score=45.13 TRINITY_DN3246_c0_g1_i1:57-506(+)
MRVLLLLLLAAGAVVADMRSPVTVHILDTTAGHPAGGVNVTLYQEAADGWTLLSGKVTDNDGRADMLPLATFVATAENPNCCFPHEALTPGVYQLVYATGPYIEKTTGQANAFMPSQSVIFRILDSQKREYFHIPILLNPFGFTAYRGS